MTRPCATSTDKDEIASGETSAGGLDEEDAGEHASGDLETNATRGDVQKTSRTLGDDSPRTRYDFRVRRIVTSKRGGNRVVMRV
ncbi:hypothetical protein E5D57_003009 [Metarhizium anisopliae]|nr:hypothetical protein E5D57_003009 [Metarhizium anisopliae]